MLGKISVECGLVPIRERVEFQATLILLEARHLQAGASLETLAARYPGVERRERAAERFDLAQIATPIGIVIPAQARPVLSREQAWIGAENAQIGEAEFLRKLVAIL